MTQAMTDHLHDGDFQTRGEKPLLLFLRWYFNNMVANEVTFQHCGITHYLPRILADAWEHFRHGEENSVAICRKDYLEELGRGDEEIVDLLDIQFQAVEKALTISTLARMMKSIIGRDPRYQRLGDHVSHQIEAYFFAETAMLSKIWDRVLREVYDRGLRDVIDASDKCGMSGQFGNVELRSMVYAGRIVFTLAKIEGGREGLEESITFIGEDGDKPGYRFGIQSIHCDFMTAMSLINELLVKWPSDPTLQAEMFTDNANIGIG